jgi:hypothetical protein
LGTTLPFHHLWMSVAVCLFAHFQHRLDSSMASLGLGDISEALKQVLSASDESSFLQLLEKNLSADSHDVRRATIDTLYDLLTDPTAEDLQSRRVRRLCSPSFHFPGSGPVLRARPLLEVVVAQLTAPDLRPQRHLTHSPPALPLLLLPSPMVHNLPFPSPRAVCPAERSRSGIRRGSAGYRRARGAFRRER